LVLVAANPFDTLNEDMRWSSRLIAVTAALCCSLAGCGYHTLGAAAHLPPGTHTLAVPVFATRTNAYRTETALTRLRVTPEDGADADTVLHGTILSQTTAPLTYNSQTQQSSSFLITISVAVTLNARDGRVLYKNDNYVFRQQYQSTTDLPTFLEENPAAIDRLSRDFARALVADVLEGF
jgi:outer membrane lipopolysaccharide assembly protein LptE/RlpB